MSSTRVTPIRLFARWHLALGLGLVLGTAPQAGFAAGPLAPVPELRIYPSGQILGLGLQRDLGNVDQGNLSLLYNRVRRGGNGRHADERGGGFGVGASYEHFSSADRLGWSLGGRADLFALRIDFRDGVERGRSDVTVLQPTVGAGYTVPVDGGLWRVRFGLDLGTEVNVRTRGSAVGEGAILLFGVSLSSPQVGRR